MTTAFDKSVAETAYVLELFGGTVVYNYETEDELRQAYEEGLDSRPAENQRMYRKHTMTFREDIAP